MSINLRDNLIVNFVPWLQHNCLPLLQTLAF